MSHFILIYRRNVGNLVEQLQSENHRQVKQELPSCEGIEKDQRSKSLEDEMHTLENQPLMSDRISSNENMHHSRISHNAVKPNVTGKMAQVCEQLFCTIMMY